jgi:hypothetical protein
MFFVFEFFSIPFFLTYFPSSYPFMELLHLHKLLNDIMHLIAFLNFLPDNHGISSMPGVNYISHVQKDRLGGSDDITDVTVSQKTIDLASWEEVLEQSTSGFHTSAPAPMGILHGHENISLDELLAVGSVVKEEFQNTLPIQSNWQVMTYNLLPLLLARSTCIYHLTSYEKS